MRQQCIIPFGLEPRRATVISTQTSADASFWGLFVKRFVGEGRSYVLALALQFRPVLGGGIFHIEVSRGAKLLFTLLEGEITTMARWKI